MGLKNWSSKPSIEGLGKQVLHINGVKLLCILIRVLCFCYWTNHLLPLKYHDINLYKAALFFFFFLSCNHYDWTLGREGLFQNGMQNPGEIPHLLWEQKWGCFPVAQSTGQGVKPWRVPCTVAMWPGSWPGRAWAQVPGQHSLVGRRDFTRLFSWAPAGKVLEVDGHFETSSSHTDKLTKVSSHQLGCVPRPGMPEESSGKYGFPSVAVPDDLA